MKTATMKMATMTRPVAAGSEEAGAILDSLVGFEGAACGLAAAITEGSRDDRGRAERDYDRTARHLLSIVLRRPATEAELDYLKGLTDAI